MKKKRTLILIPLLLAVCGLMVLLTVALGRSWVFYAEGEEVDGFYISINRLSDRCFAGWYRLQVVQESYEITVPDEFDGCPVTMLGGVEGGYTARGMYLPFYIDLAIFMNAEEGTAFAGVYDSSLEERTFDVEYTVEPVVFVLNIGKNLKTVYAVDMDEYYPHVNEDGSVTFYYPVVYIRCSEDNPNFYSENGKLYDRETGELIDDFAYAAESGSR